MRSRISCGRHSQLAPSSSQSFSLLCLQDRLRVLSHPLLGPPPSSFSFPWRPRFILDNKQRKGIFFPRWMAQLNWLLIAWKAWGYTYEQTNTFYLLGWCMDTEWQNLSFLNHGINHKYNSLLLFHPWFSLNCPLTLPGFICCDCEFVDQCRFDSSYQLKRHSFHSQTWSHAFCMTVLGLLGCLLLRSAWHISDFPAKENHASRFLFWVFPQLTHNENVVQGGHASLFPHCPSDPVSNSPLYM